jgi:hypothetical protein
VIPATGNEEAVPWEDLRPIIDGAMLKLSTEQRTAVLLRYFENRSFSEIGTVLGLTENAARMRVSRALETLRSVLRHHSITSSLSGLGLALSSHAATAVNPGVAAAIAQAVLSAPLSTGLFFAMTSSTIKFAGAVVVAAASLTYGLYERSERRHAADDAAKLRATVVQLEGLKPAPMIAPVSSYSVAIHEKTATAPKNPSTPPPPTSVDASDPATNPDARKLYLVKEAAKITMNVKPYFKTLGLTEEQWNAYVKAILEGMEVELDAKGLAREKGLTSKQQELAMVEAMGGARKNLLEAIGADANKKLIEFNQRLVVRPRAEELAAKLAFSDEPLTRDQSAAIVDALTNYRHQGKLRLRADGILLVPDEAMEEMRTLLSPLQFEIFQQQEIVRRSDVGLAKLKTASKPSRP